MNPLKTVNELRQRPRWAVKGFFLLVVLVGVTYPRPSLLVRAIRHSADLDALIDAREPTLQPWLVELREGLAPEVTETDPALFAKVETFVRHKVPYEWDWNTWGVMEYTPTVAEVIAMGKEDCDGRAVVAASLLKGLGYEPRLVTDLKHVWVWTPQGEFMSPGGPKVFEPTKTGLRFNWRSVWTWPANFAFGLAVYPLSRELVMLLAIWLCGLNMQAGRWGWAASLLLLIQGVLIVRLSAWDHRHFIHWGIWLAWGHIIAALAILWKPPRARANA